MIARACPFFGEKDMLMTDCCTIDHRQIVRFLFAVGDDPQVDGLSCSDQLAAVHDFCRCVV